MPDNTKKIAVGLDIGTTKICVIVIEKTEENTYNILSCAVTENTGVNRGVITNIEKTVEAIQKVIQEAEQQAGIKINEVVVGMAGDHIESLSEVSTITISSKSQIVSKADVERAIDELRRSKISSDKKIIHIVPYEFIIDGQDGIINPIGMYGVRLQANVHIVTGMRTAVQNIHHCVEKGAGLHLKDVILEPIASSLALLDDDEQEVGVCLIDIGGGTTDITIFKDNVLRFTTVIGIGGNRITGDVRTAFKTTAVEAERIKCDYGHTYKPSIMKKDDIFMIRGVGGIPPLEISKEELCEVIQPRVEELFEMCNEEIIKSGFAGKLGAGIVLTGGSALLRGADELAYRIFSMPIRVGYPSGNKYRGLADAIESPKYSTAVGLALHSLNMNAIQGETIFSMENVVPDMAVDESANTAPDEKDKGKDSGKFAATVTKLKDFITKL